MPKMGAAPTTGQGLEVPQAPSGSIKGRLEVAPELAGKVSAGDAIYLVARNPVTGSIIAVRRLAAPAKFPMDFELSGQDTMHEQGSLSGKIHLEARVDKDGDAMTKNPGDLVGEVRDPVSVPAEGVVLVFSKVL